MMVRVMVLVMEAWEDEAVGSRDAAVHPSRLGFSPLVVVPVSE